jgi:enoyl-CoA hydratase/carnithine racemase
MTDLVLVQTTDGVCHLRLNRPDKRNAITFAMYGALEAALSAANTNDSVRALLLSGEGAGFCAGNDLHDFINGGEFSASHPVLGFLRGLVNLQKPLVAAVHGQTVGIGVTMILHCDLVVAADSTRFSMPFVSLGLVPEAASSLLLPQRIGPQRAAELLLLGKPFDAATAASLGIVNRVVAEAATLSEARSIAASLAAQPPEALRATRRLLRGDLTAQLARIDAEADIFGAQLKSAEFMNAVQGFLAKAKLR